MASTVVRVQTNANVQRILERVAYGVAEAAEAIGISETYLRSLVIEGRIPSIRVGKRRLIRKNDLQSFVDDVFDEQHNCAISRQKSA